MRGMANTFSRSKLTNSGLRAVKAKSLFMRSFLPILIPLFVAIFSGVCRWDGMALNSAPLLQLSPFGGESRGYTYES